VGQLGEVVGTVLLLVGTVFCVLGVYGLLRLPDLYNRLHAGAKVATFGAGGVLLSLLFLAPPQAGFKGLATALFLLLTAPLVTHVLARAAYRLRVPLADEPVRDDLAEDRSVGVR
jgi:multicomponent Na+:H+ antiporter subunit G